MESSEVWTIVTDPSIQRGPLWGHTPASQKRRQDILVAAKKAFFENGYTLTSIDRIAAVAGTTKRTVYDHFGSKDALFAEVIAFASEQFVMLLPAAEALPVMLAEGLRTFVDKLTELVTRSDSIHFQRLVIAEAERHPQFGQVLYETAMLGAERVLADYLRARIADGQAPPQDPECSARLVLDLTTNGSRIRALIAADGEGAVTRETAMDLALVLVTLNRQPSACAQD